MSFSFVGAFPLATTAVAASSSQAATSNIEVQAIPGPTVADTIRQRTLASWPWYLTRASGLVAAVALTLLLLSGVGLVTGGTFRFLEPLTAWASHRALGITFGVAVIIHIASILFDHFVPFSIWQALIPWLSPYKPLTLLGLHLGSFYVALGIFAFYLALIVMITSLVWVEKKPKIWKLIHFLSYLLMLLVFLHALLIGTDLLHGVLRWLWIGAGLAIAVAVIARMRRAFTT